ncbi:hypothetical protein PRIPAC_96279 [Pristionchus pacificus]|uniref:Uncharacterized protein n=1 Tax=Pristionchus pacificus TaxID=54126 RepID=A0A2A6D1X2_PRIPA|nr:hypothetical protein PRIPAC_96279 [Pristionchus pacificus]|eukprot:PDM84482.1 hypothetical protein PRIPAC_33505 [Pristionchus pacificus]
MIQVGDTRRVAQADGRGFSKLEVEESGETLFAPWPAVHPTLTVPFVDRELYKAVNFYAGASQLSNGLDLPFDNMTTLRFFFNLGVQQSRDILLSQLHDKVANGSPQLAQQLIAAATAAFSNRESVATNSSSTDTFSRGTS